MFSFSFQVPKGVISIVPETRMVDMVREARKIDPNCRQCQGILVQGTDGIWDCVTGLDILNIIRSKQKSIRQLQRYLATAGKDCKSARFAPNRNRSDSCSGIWRLRGKIVSGFQECLEEKHIFSGQLPVSCCCGRLGASQLFPPSRPREPGGRRFGACRRGYRHLLPLQGFLG